MNELIGRATVQFGKTQFTKPFHSHLSNTKQLLRKGFLYSSRDYKEYGLLYYDVVGDTPKIEEALRRLRYAEPNVFFERQHRISRAIDWHMKRYKLPKEQWITYEEDVPYLKPFLRTIDDEENDKAKYDP
ncbi:hypothetical protein GJ496_007512 [Pomphorhynchus laevis]|nr:hypothetical protein GJ496_007512 [Pomphorhynchus laevis]